ncbi:hypothetical protein MTO96_001519 [Rhipicephalus appendiculatus]
MNRVLAGAFGTLLVEAFCLYYYGCLVLERKGNSDRIGKLYNIIHWTSAEQNKFKASNGHRLKRRDDSTAANSGTVEEIQG